MANLPSRVFLFVSLGVFVGACNLDSPHQPVVDSSTDTRDLLDAGQVAEHCTSGERDGDETDVDCGGSCSPCLPGMACIETSDCVSGQCIGQVCVNTGPSCDEDDECDDGDLCNGIWTCVAGTCLETTVPVVCAAQDACHLAGTCAPATGVCTNPSKTCDDANPCTVDTCDGATGCVYTDKDCDDNDPATADSCDVATGDCQHLIPYVDNGDGTVTDIRTNLVWQQTPNTEPFKLCQNMMDYSECPAEIRDAANHCESNADGLPGVGWRLPSISELRSIIEGCEATFWNPVTKTGGECDVTDDCLSYWGCGVDCRGCKYLSGPGEDGYYISGIFDNSGHGWFWSFSPSVMYIDRGWSVAFYSGLLNNNYIFNDFGVRCVREGP